MSGVSVPIRPAPLPGRSGRVLILIPFVVLGLYLLVLFSNTERNFPNREPGEVHSALSPDVRVSDAEAVLLRNQYRHYLRAREAGKSSGAIRAAVHKYNQFAVECPAEVFRKTSLPRSLP